MTLIGNWKRWAATKKEWTVSVTKAVSPLGLQGATSRDGPLGNREGTTASP